MTKASELLSLSIPLATNNVIWRIAIISSLDLAFLTLIAAPTKKQLTKLLNSIEAQIALKFRPPHSSLKYNPQAKGLIIAWDLFWASYRAISAESVDVISVMPVRTDDEILKFWEYFNDYMSKLSPEARASFGNM